MSRCGRLVRLRVRTVQTRVSPLLKPKMKCVDLSHKLRKVLFFVNRVLPFFVGASSRKTAHRREPIQDGRLRF